MIINEKTKTIDIKDIADIKCKVCFKKFKTTRPDIDTICSKLCLQVKIDQLRNKLTELEKMI